MNNGLYEHLRVFVAIAQARSLTAASIATGIGQATISRQLQALEDYLGCRLFHRSTRSISLTEQGETYLPHALQILDMVSTADASVQDKKARLRGRIRVACSNGFGRKLLIPALPRWQQMHPDIKLELILSDQLSQVIEERVDLAFRLATLPDSNLVARPIGVSRRIVVASAAYLNKHGTVLEPAHLQKHQCILFAGAEHADVWRFNGPHGMSSTHVQGKLSLSTMDAIYDAVMASVLPSRQHGSGLGNCLMDRFVKSCQITRNRHK